MSSAMNLDLRLVSCLVVLGSGCGSALEEPPSAATAVQAATGIEQEQGIYILGKIPDGLFDGVHHFRVATTATAKRDDKAHYGTGVSVSAAAQGAYLIATLGGATHSAADPWLVGMILDGVDRGQVRLEVGAQSDGTTTRYHLSYRETTSAPWAEYCDDATVLAVPLRGWYDGRRFHHDADTISFACDNGVARKCTLWGYVAGTGGPGDHAWDRHQACTRMANADACGDGAPKTRELTPILIRDYDGSPNAKPMDAPKLATPDPLPGDPDVDYFEAGWAPGGAVCLAKRRWVALPPNPCPGALPDPRFIEGRQAGGRFCDELDLAALGSRALLANGSKVMDAPLHVWRSAATSNDLVTTMQGYFALPGNPSPPPPAPPAPPIEQVAPFPTELCGGGPCYGFHAGVDSMVLRNLPGSLDAAADMVELHLWRKPAGAGFDRVLGLATTPPATGFVDAGFEAYAFKRADQFAPRTLPALKLCRTGTGYFNTIGSCATLVAVLGYALPPP